MEKRSRVISRTVDPEWDEMLDMDGVLDEFVTHGLQMRVLDKDRFKYDDLLGRLHVSLESLRSIDEKDVNILFSQAQSVAQRAFSTPYPPHPPFCHITHPTRNSTFRSPPPTPALLCVNSFHSAHTKCAFPPFAPTPSVCPGRPTSTTPFTVKRMFGTTTVPTCSS